MIQSHGRVQTPIAEAMRERLCRHFAKKIPVRNGEREGVAQFPQGECRIWGEGDILRFSCVAADETALLQMQGVIDQHVAMFSRRAPLAVRWEEST